MGSVISNASSFERKKFNELYELGEEIGVGAFSTVHKCYRKNDSHEFAVKSINKCYLSNKELIGLQNEIHILRKISHKNIIKLIDVFDDGTNVLLILELCMLKDLYDEIVCNKNKKFTEQKSAQIIFEICTGLKYLHSKGVVHRDLKVDNILFGMDGNLKISDFGLASICNKLTDENSTENSDDQSSNESNESRILYTACGTPHYVAPEILINNGYDKKCDIWSIGVILYVLLIGNFPFNAKSNDKIYTLITNGKYNTNSKIYNNISNDAKDLIKCLLEINPIKRYSINDILSHKWIIKNVNRFAVKESEI